MWTLESVHRALAPAFAMTSSPGEAGYFCGDTMALAEPTSRRRHRREHVSQRSDEAA